MKRFALFLLAMLLMSFGFTIPAARAASSGKSIHQTVRYLASMSHKQSPRLYMDASGSRQVTFTQAERRNILVADRKIATAVATPSFHTMAVDHAPTRQSASNLAILDDPFVSPYLQSSGVVSPGNVVFTHSHSAGYPGLVTGYGESAQVGNVTFLYQGSIFSSAGAASSAFRDALNTVGSFSTIAPNDCSSTFSAPCTIIVFEGGTGTTRVIYEEVQVNYCLVEGESYGPDSVYDDNTLLNDVSSIQAHYFVEGVHLAMAACTGVSPNSQPPTSIPPTAVRVPPTAIPAPPTSTPVPPTATPVPPTATPVPPTATPVPHTEFHIVTVQLQKSGGSSNAQLPALTKIKHGKGGTLYTLIQVTSGRAGLSASYSFVVKSGSKTVVNRTMSGVLHSPNPQSSYQASLPVKFKNRGTYVFTERVTIDGITQSDATSFSVVK
jgi:hypothetical protein